MPISVATLERYLRMAARTRSVQRPDAGEKTPARSTRHTKATGSGANRQRRSSVSHGNAPVPATGSREEDGHDTASEDGTSGRAPMAARSAGGSVFVAGENPAKRSGADSASQRGTAGGAPSDNDVPMAADHPQVVNSDSSTNEWPDARAPLAADAPRAMPTAGAQVGSSPAAPVNHRDLSGAAGGTGTGVETDAATNAAVKSPASAESSGSTTPMDKAGPARPPTNPLPLGNIGFMPRR
jgi:hypothetical protein